MKKYFYDNNAGRVISLNELNGIRSELYPDKSMEQFLSDCSYRNNGTIEPLFMEITRQKKLALSMEEELKELHAYIEYLEEINREV